MYLKARYNLYKMTNLTLMTLIVGDLEGQILSGIYQNPIFHTKCELSMKKFWH